MNVTRARSDMTQHDAVFIRAVWRKVGREGKGRDSALMSTIDTPILY